VSERRKLLPVAVLLALLVALAWFALGRAPAPASPEAFDREADSASGPLLSARPSPPADDAVSAPGAASPPEASRPLVPTVPTLAGATRFQRRLSLGAHLARWRDEEVAGRLVVDMTHIRAVQPHLLSFDDVAGPMRRGRERPSSCATSRTPTVGPRRCGSARTDLHPTSWGPVSA
jgi:hypothetical protein